METLNIPGELSKFNRAFIATKGMGMFHAVELKGPSDLVEKIAVAEAEIMCQAGIYAQKDLIGINDHGPGVCMVKRSEFKEENLDSYHTCIDNGWLLLFTKVPPSLKKYTRFVSIDPVQEKLRQLLSGMVLKISAEQLLNFLDGKDWMTVSETMFTNYTLECHFQRYDDMILHAEDLEWMRPAILESSTDVSALEAVTSSVRAEETTPYKKEAKNKPAVTDVSAQIQEQKPSSGTDSILEHDRKADAQSMQNHPEHTDQNEKEPLDQDIPVPQVVSGADIKESVGKSIITAEENINNYRLMNEISDRYKEVKKFIHDLHDGRFRRIELMLEDHINEKTFNADCCHTYMKIDKDFASELYAKLYDLDQDTHKYQNEIVRLMIPLACPGCNNEWQIDATFTEPGIYYAECPECSATRPYERPEIK